MESKNHDLLDLAFACRSFLGELGIQLLFLSDVDEFERRMRDIGKVPAHPLMSPAHYDFSSVNSCAVVLRIEGRDVGGVAAHFFDLGGQSLGEHWSKMYRRLYDELGQVHSPAPLIRDTIRGRAVYLGEMRLLKKPDGPRGVPGVSAAALVYIQAIAQLFWDPEWIHAFVREEDARRGKPVQYGFTYTIPMAQQWERTPDRRFETEHFVANDRAHVFHLAAMVQRDPEYLYGQFAPDSSAT